MIEKVKKALFDFTSAVQARKLYSKEHPEYSKNMENAYKGIKDILSTKNKFIIGIIDDELAWENEILFDVSRKVKSLLTYLQDRNIEKIIFFLPLEQWELDTFISYLSLPVNEHTEDVQQYLIENRIKNIQAGKIKALSQQEKTGDRYSTEKEIFRAAFQNSIELTRESITKILDNKEVDYLDLRFNISTLIENYAGDYSKADHLISLKKKDFPTFVHQLNVSVLSMFLASKLGLSKDRIIDIGISSLFHDIGKTAASKKTEKDESEPVYRGSDERKDYGTAGSKVLLGYKNSLGILPVVIAYEHHLIRNNACSEIKYPLKPHLASMIIAICDVYDELFQKYLYEECFSLEDIHNGMTEGKKYFFDRELVDRFFEILGVWPIGTIVLLNDERVGRVIKVNKKYIFRPVVKILSPESKKGMTDLSKENKKIKILRSLNPFGEGKKYTDSMVSE